MERTDQKSSEDLKRLVKELGDTIQRTLAESPQISNCLNRMRSEGYEVSLMLEATIGFNRRDQQEAEISTLDFRVAKPEPSEPKMTPLDRRFLRSLKIAVEDE